MSTIHQIAIFGATPLSLLLGRACGLKDRLPIGLLDPNSEVALRGALHLGISAFEDPARLHSPQTPLQLAIIGNPEGASVFAELSDRETLPLALCLFPETPQLSSKWCQAVPLVIPTELETSIAASIPHIDFRIHASSPEDKKAGQKLLAELSPTFQFSD